MLGTLTQKTDRGAAAARRAWRGLALLLALVAALAAARPAQASTGLVEARFAQQDGTYVFTIDDDELFHIDDVQEGADYTGSITFANSAAVPMRVTLVSVEELTQDTYLYDHSYLGIDDAGNLRTSELANAEFATVVPAGQSTPVTFHYTLANAPVREPDNSWMGEQMRFRLTFVAEYDVPGTKRAQAAPWTGDATTWESAVALGGVGAALVLLAVVARRRRSSDEDQAAPSATGGRKGGLR